MREYEKAHDSHNEEALNEIVGKMIGSYWSSYITEEYDDVMLYESCAAHHLTLDAYWC